MVVRPSLTTASTISNASFAEVTSDFSRKYWLSLLALIFEENAFLLKLTSVASSSGFLSITNRRPEGFLADSIRIPSIKLILKVRGPDISRRSISDVSWLWSKN